MKSLISFLFLSTGLDMQASAACFKADPFFLPTSEVKATIDELSEQLYGFGESPEGMELSPYPPVQTGLKEQRALKVSGKDSITVRYYEVLAGNTYRICRSDLWLPTQDNEYAREAIANTKRLTGHVLSEQLAKSNRTLGFSTIYAYDSKGRVERIEKADFTKSSKVEFKAQHCRRYDEKDRVVLWVNPSATHSCPKGEPSQRDEWREYRFGIYEGTPVQIRSRWHLPKKGGWIEKWTSFRIDSQPNSIGGNANVDDRRGVWEIFGSTYGKLDNNSANTVVDGTGRWNGSNYYFPQPPVSISILERPEELYKHLRRRITHVDGRIRLVELFKPGEHISKHRFYTFLGNVLRHEQLDAKGKVSRIITVNDWRQPRPGPKPDFDDRLLTVDVPDLKAHQVYHRVYDVPPNGQPKLVAISWNRSMRNPLKKTPLLEADLVFGTPDGKEKWKTREAFDSAFDTSADARQVFPDSPDEDIDD